MSIFVNTSKRSSEEEIMDDFEMSGDLLIKTLDQIALINKWLGGNRITLDGVDQLLQSKSKENKIVIIDLGCGNGDMLREIADYGRRNNFLFELKGYDANQTTIDYAIDLSKRYSEIKYFKEDVLKPSFDTQEYDIALCTLFLHHFENDIAFDLVNRMITNSKIGIVINDLHRHIVAYYLFKLLTLVINNKMVQTDGLISILRGFKKKNLIHFANKLTFKSSINWKWAFRFQWIINK